MEVGKKKYIFGCIFWYSIDEIEREGFKVWGECGFLVYKIKEGLGDFFVGYINIIVVVKNIKKSINLIILFLNIVELIKKM